MRIDWQRLNAYIDGELGPAEAAEVAATLARQPDLAARVASLSRLKAATGALTEDEELPPLPRRRRPLPLAGALAATVAALVVLALWLWPASAPPSAAWLDRAVAAHNDWLAAVSTKEAMASLPTAVAQAGTDGIPDLSEAHLTLVYVRFLPEQGREHALQLGYVGIHGCRVSLWISAAVAGLNEQPAAVQAKGVEGYAWLKDDTGYAFLALGMDPERLRLLAEAVARITQQGHGVDDASRVALHHTTEVGNPCAA